MKPKENNTKVRAARAIEMPADETDEFERLANAAIHELVFACQFVTQDDYESALTCLTQVRMNTDRLADMAVKYDPANQGTTEDTENTEGEARPPEKRKIVIYTRRGSGDCYVARSPGYKPTASSTSCEMHAAERLALKIKTGLKDVCSMVIQDHGIEVRNVMADQYTAEWREP